MYLESYYRVMSARGYYSFEFKSRKFKFSQPEENDIGYGPSSIDISNTNDDFLVPTTIGDILVKNNEISPPNVVKIDVEGTETLVNNEMEDILAAPDCRELFCEVHLPEATIRPSIKDFGSSSKEIEVKLQRLGFSVQRLGKNELTLSLKAEKY